MKQAALFLNGMLCTKEFLNFVMSQIFCQGHKSVNQSITDISLVGAISHEEVNRGRRWMAVSGMTCRWR